MPKYFHRTLVSPSYVINVVEGKWIPEEVVSQYLVHYGTVFDIFGIEEGDQEHFVRLFRQNLFSLSYGACQGPLIDNISSVFILRQTSILQMSFSIQEGLFVIQREISLPKTCHNANYIHYNGKHLLVSSASGGICVFDGNSYELVTQRISGKGVLSCFVFGTDRMGRIEYGSKLAVYRISNLSQLSVERGLYFHAFPFGKDGRAVSGEGKITVHDLSETVEIASEAIGHITSHAYLSKDCTVLLTEYGSLYAFSGRGIRSLRVRYPGAYGVFKMSEKRVMICRKGLSHLVFDLVSESVIESLSINAMSAVRRVSLHDHRIVIASTSSICFAERGLQNWCEGRKKLPDKIQNLEGFEVKGKQFVAATNAYGTIFMEISVDNLELAELGDMPLNTAVNTIAIIPLTQDQYIQVHDGGFMLLDFGECSQDDIMNVPVRFCAHENRQILIVTKGNEAHRVYVDEHQEMKMEQRVIRDQVEIRCAVFVPCEDGLSTSLLYIAGDRLMCKRLRIGENSPMKAEEITKIANAQSMSFSSGKLCVGVNGSVMICDFDEFHGIIRNAVYLHLGSVPVHLFGNFVVGSHVWMINKNVEIEPLYKTAGIEHILYLGNNEVLISRSTNLQRRKICSGEVQTFLEVYSVLLDEESYVRDVIRLRSNYFLIARDARLDGFKIGAQEPSVLFNFKNNEVFALMMVLGDELLLVTHYRDNSCVRIFELDDMELLAEIRIKEHVKAACSFQDGFLLAAADTLAYYQISGDSIMIVARIACIGKRIEKIMTNESIVFIGDANMSLFMLSYSSERKQFDVVAQDTFMRSITAMDRYDATVVAGDFCGCISMIDTPVNAKNKLSVFSRKFTAMRRLPTKMSYFIGEVITSINSQTGSFIYSTVNGTVGAFIEYVNEHEQLDFAMRLKTLKSVEIAMAPVLKDLTGCDFLRFRNEFMPCNQVVDMDLVNLYLVLSTERRVSISNSLHEKILPEEIDQIISLANSYFSYLF